MEYKTGSTSSAANPNGPCPCGTGQHSAACCGPYLNGTAQPDTAERLMRSRYTAYVMADEAYLLASWHTTSRPAELALNTTPTVQWLGLKIVRTQDGGSTDQRGLVEFVARYKIGGKATRLHEVSEFIREGGRWYYVRGTVNNK